MNRSLASAGLVLSMATAGFSAEFPSESFESFLSNHCYECHDDVTSKAGLNLFDLDPKADSREALAVWTHVHQRIEAGEMPPKDQPQPSQAEAETFLGETSQRLSDAYETLYQEEGRVPARRLNPLEFENTLRDLLASPWLELKQILPAEPNVHGFDNIAEAQEFSYVQMSRYLEAAEVAVDGAMQLRPPPEITTMKVGFGETPRFVNRDGWAMMFRQPNSAQAPWRISGKHQKDAGWYRFKVHCKAVRYENTKVHPTTVRQVAAINTAAKRFLHTFDVYPEPHDVEFVAWLNQDDMLEFYCANLDDRTCPRDKDKQEGKEEKMRGFKGEGVAVKHIEIEGPFAGPACDEKVEAWPPEGYRRLFGDLPTAPWTADSGLLPPEKLHLPDLTANKRGVREPRQLPTGNTMVVSTNPRADAERLLRAFLERAYRTAVPESEFERCFAFAEKAIARKACFQDVMRAAYQAVLSSPDFLFFHESPGRLDSRQLATRLSYFLWRTAPDKALLERDLTDESVLAKTVDELLNDERSSRFVADFCGQWLDLRKLYDTTPDRYLFPDYWGDSHLFDSARAESETTFAEMLENDLPAINVVRSDFVMVNERLAELYGIPGVEGVKIRRVSVPKDSPRGGLLSQASVMKVTANGLTTSPVLRGVWVLDRLLGDHPAAPPPNVGSIEPDTRGATTVREQLDKHREVESCASCHNEIDPPGFALEEFDVMGGWRDRYRTTEGGHPIALQFASKDVRIRRGPKVDASGQTPDGNKFSNYREFRDGLLDQEEQIARNLVERLLTFATGAGITFVDEREVEGILEKTKPSGYGLRSIVREVILSPTFRNK